MDQVTRFFENIGQSLGIKIKLPKVTNQYFMISLVVIIVSLACLKFSMIFLIPAILAGGNLLLVNREY
ncbi:hypothetical protein IW492_08555 [Enterococcus sp. BWB1-3]|uniref:hypothetical protein n=1 Tax=unclassified Enterococcus TaxID=2608891 RepID=UPI0019248978|nr:MULTISPECIES: hypothetical protein [unclassified Enterococcus]MBL1229281.1 hypothetical protein [Enterococcus sp. BWB1-3]MCB5951771.1 hypothetical protein [Enterococcus sp. BWT-B8]